jgi:hypothetical protein
MHLQSVLQFYYMYSLVLLKNGDYDAFLSHISGYAHSDRHVVQYVGIILQQGGDALALLSRLRVNMWSRLSRVYSIRALSQQSNSTVDAMLRMGPFCSEHLL